MIRSLPSTRIVRFVLAPILSLWIAGAGCMIGCEGMVATAATVPSSSQEKHSGHHSGQKASIVASGHACSSSGSHSCCAKSAAETKSAAKQTSKSESVLVTVSGSSSGMMKTARSPWVGRRLLRRFVPMKLPPLQHSATRSCLLRMFWSEPLRFLLPLDYPIEDIPTSAVVSS